MLRGGGEERMGEGRGGEGKHGTHQVRHPELAVACRGKGAHSDGSGHLPSTGLYRVQGLVCGGAPRVQLVPLGTLPRELPLVAVGQTTTYTTQQDVPQQVVSNGGMSRSETTSAPCPFFTRTPKACRQRNSSNTTTDYSSDSSRSHRAARKPTSATAPHESSSGGNGTARGHQPAHWQ